MDEFTLGQRLHSRNAISKKTVYIVVEIQETGLFVSPVNADDIRYFSSNVRAREMFFPAEALPNIECGALSIRSYRLTALAANSFR